MVHFDANDKAQYGKWRPLESDGSAHQCPGPQEQNVYQEHQQQPQQQHTIPGTPYPRQTMNIPQQQQVPSGMPRPLVVQVEKGTWDRLREQIININRMMSQVTIDIGEIKQDIALIKSANPQRHSDQERTSDEIYGRADDAEF